MMSLLHLIIIIAILLVGLECQVSRGQSASNVFCKRLIQLADGSNHWLTDTEVLDLIRDRIKFMDITYRSRDYSGKGQQGKNLSGSKIPQSLSPQIASMVDCLSRSISKSQLRSNLRKFTSFHTRYYRSPQGIRAANWLYQRLRSITYKTEMKVSIQRLIHVHWPQPSIRCRLENGGNHDDEVIVISAHLDSISFIAPHLVSAPGADDDGSGVITLLEVARILTSTNIRLKRPIDLLFFAAEEGGLLGSQEIAKYYQEQGIAAKILHIDMDGYVKGNGLGRGIGVLTDNVDNHLTEFLKSLIKRHTALPIKETKCGYACSDHYSWHLMGYPTAASFEGTFEEQSPFIHTPWDTVERIDFDHVSEFVKVALAYAMHLGQ